MKLYMRSTYASPTKIVSFGEVGDFPTSEAKELLAGGFAREATKEEITASGKRQSLLAEIARQHAENQPREGWK